MADEGMVIVWVTNKQKYVRFTKFELFPHWSVDLVAEWHWVKVSDFDGKKLKQKNTTCNQAER